MKRILVLGPGRPGVPSLERRQFDVQRSALDEEALTDGAEYSSVIVINDGGPDTVRRLLTALRVHHYGKGTCVGVLSYLDDAVSQKIISKAGSAPGARPADPLPIFLNLEPRLRIGLDGEVLSFEYQAV